MSSTIQVFLSPNIPIQVSLLQNLPFKIRVKEYPTTIVIPPPPDDIFAVNLHATSILYVGSNTSTSNVVITETTFKIGNSTVNTFINSSSISVIRANVSGNLSVSGITTLGGNIVFGTSGLSANGSFGNPGQVLHSNGSATFWGPDDDASAYANGVIYTDNKTAQTYSNAVTYTDAKAANAYSNATIYADARAANAYSNAVVYANAQATNAYNYAILYAELEADNAYSNSVTYTNIKSGEAYSNAITYADIRSANAYSNGVTYTDNKTAQTYTNATTYSSNADNITSGTLNTARLPATANISTGINVGANVNVNTSTIQIGNSTVNTSISSATIVINGVNVNTAITSNAAAAYSNATAYADARAANAYSNSVSYTDARAANAYSNATTFSSNADNITSGTLNTARLPATVNVSTAFNLGANVNVNTSTIFVGNSTVNTSISAATITLNGVNVNTAITSNAATAYTNAITIAANADNITSGTLNTARLPATANLTTALNVGANVNVNTSAVFIGNSTVNTSISAATITINGVNVNTAITSNAATAYSNATAYADSRASTAYSNATAYADSRAATAFSNAATRADNAYTNAVSYTDTKTATTYSNATAYADARAANAYSNAVAYAASNSYVNSTFLPLAGGTLNGNLTVNASANIVSNLAANNVTFRGSVQIDGNLTVSGNTVTISTTNLALEDNMIYLNDGSTTSNPDLGFAGNYNDGSYKHAGFFRDATDGIWKVFDGYTPEPDASAFIDTSNNTFRIADFQANVVTANGFTGNGFNITSINATSIASGTLNTARLPATVNVATAFNLGANVNVNTSVIFVGNSTVNTSISAATIILNGVNVNTAITSNAVTAYSNAIAYSGNAVQAYTNATTFSSNADNITSGTLNTARLPATANLSTALNVGANVNVNTSTMFVGNSTVNTSISAATITINGVNVNTAITSNASAAYTNAIAIAANADNLSSGTVAFARLPALYLGTTQIQSTSVAQAVTGVTTLAAGNTTITGFANVSSTLQVTGVATLSANVAVQNYILANNSSANNEMLVGSDSGGFYFGTGFSRAPNTIPILIGGSTGNIRFSSNGQERVIIAANGNVGIANTTPASKLVIQDTLTANATSTFEINPTWNATANTFTALRINVTDTASASGSLLQDWQVAGSSKANVRKDGRILALAFESGSSGYLTPTFGTVGYSARSADGFFSIASDTFLVRDAANIFAQRNGVNAQTFRVYNTFTDASNYERGQFAYSSNILIIGHENAGTGASRAVQIRAGASHGVALCSQSTVFWQATSSGHWLAGTDNTYDIGASGVNRPRDVYVANLTTSGFFSAQNSGYYQWSGRSRIFSPSDGVIGIYNNAETSFSRLQFGGTTSSFPSLKRNAATLEARLADDSAYAAFTALGFNVLGGTVTTSVPLFDATQAWNNASQIFTALKLNITDTASSASSLLVDLQVGGTSMVRSRKDGRFYVTEIASRSGPLNLIANDVSRATATAANFNVHLDSGAGSYSIAYDTYLYRDAANIFAQRNTTNAQTSRIYGTYTDGSNYERLSISANSTAQYVQTEQAGTGASKSLHLGANNTTHVAIAANGNIGIGTTTPATKLSVSGTTTLSGNITISSTSSVTANGSVGTAGDVLLSNGSAVYWGQNNIDGGTPFSVF